MKVINGCGKTCHNWHPLSSPTGHDFGQHLHKIYPFLRKGGGKTGPSLAEAKPTNARNRHEPPWLDKVELMKIIFAKLKFVYPPCPESQIWFLILWQSEVFMQDKCCRPMPKQINHHPPRYGFRGVMPQNDHGSHGQCEWERLVVPLDLVVPHRILKKICIVMSSRWKIVVIGHGYLVGGLEHQFYFPIYWESHHPN